MRLVGVLAGADRASDEPGDRRDGSRYGGAKAKQRLEGRVGDELVDAFEHLVQRKWLLDATKSEGGNALQGYGRDDAEGTESDSGGLEELWALVG